MDANSFEYLISFGASLTDARNDFNFFSALGIPFPFQPVAEGFYDDGRFSNGPIWIEYFANELELDVPIPATELSILAPEAPIPSPFALNSEGLPIVSPFYAGNTVGTGVNFAFGGSSFVTGNGLADGDEGPFPTVTEAVEWLIQDYQQAGQQIDENALVTFLIPGIADYGGTGNLFALIPEVVGAIANTIEDLYDNGARNFLISNLPNYARLPGIPPEIVEVLSALTEEHNIFLENTINTLQAELEDATIFRVDIFNLLEDVTANPNEFGLSESVVPYLPPPPEVVGTDFNGGDPNNFFWWDFGNHPTTVGHEIIAQEALEALELVIDGTPNTDILTGTGKDEILLGRGGGDLVLAAGGNDRIFGHSGKDFLYAGKGNDFVDGGDDNDLLIGRKGDDVLRGGDGNDLLIGNKGDDILIGIDANNSLGGLYEVDKFRGGKGSDRFILSDSEQVYYNGDGIQGFGHITDFKLSQGDVVQLHGSASDYLLEGDGGNTRILFHGTSGPDLIGLLKNVNVNSISLTGVAFEFS